MFKENIFLLTFKARIYRLMIGISAIAWLAGALCFSGIPKMVQSLEKQNDKVTSLLRLGKVIEPITLMDTKGEKWNLQDQKEAKATVITFLDFKCPISNR